MTTADSPATAQDATDVLSWLFSFRGRIGRVRYLAGLSLAVLLAVLIAAVSALLPGTAASAPGLFAALAVILWPWFALAAKRLRDIGAPVLILPAMMVVGVVDRLVAQEMGWSFLWPDEPVTPVAAILNLALMAALVFMPGRAAPAPQRLEIVTPARQAPRPAVILAGFVAAVAGVGLTYDPWAPTGCPAAQADGADCTRYGAAGRIYAATLMVRANSAMDDKRPDAALAIIDRVLTIRPNFVFAFNSRGLAYAQKGDHAQAVEAYDRSLALGPEYLKARVNRAVSHQALGDKSAAASDFAAVYEAGPAAAENVRAYARAVDRSS